MITLLGILFLIFLFIPFFCLFVSISWSIAKIVFSIIFGLIGLSFAIMSGMIFVVFPMIGLLVLFNLLFGKNEV